MTSSAAQRPAAFARDTDVVLFDLIGIGRSEIPGESLGATPKLCFGRSASIRMA